MWNCEGMIREDYVPTKEERAKMDELMAKYDVMFSGYQALVTRNPFGSMRRFYGCPIQLCIVKFDSTRIFCDDLYREYCSTLLRPMFKEHPYGLRVIIPRTVFVDGTQEGWEREVAKVVLDRGRCRGSGSTVVVVLEGIYWLCESVIHYKRIGRILDELERLAADAAVV